MTVYNSNDLRYQFRQSVANPSKLPHILYLVVLIRILYTGYDLGISYDPFEKQWIAQFPTDLPTSYQHVLWRKRINSQATVDARRGTL